MLGPQLSEATDDGGAAGAHPSIKSDSATASTEDADLQTLVHSISIAQIHIYFGQLVAIETPPRSDWILGHFSPKHVLPAIAVAIPRIPICGYGVVAYLT